MAVAPSLSARAVVIGAGIIGINAALALRERGFAVTVVDLRSPGTATSQGNAGCFATADITPVSMPGLIWSVPRMLADPLGPLSLRWRNLPTLAPWLWRFWRASGRNRVETITRALASIVGRTWQDYEPVLAAAGALPLIRRKGGLFVFETASGFARAGYEWDLRTRNGVKAEILDADAIHDLEPALARRFPVGYFVPDWGHTTDPEAIVVRLADHLRGAGGVVLQARAEDFRFEGGRPASIRLSTGADLAFDTVVIAAGAWSKSLCRMLGHSVPLDTERGYNTTVAEPETTLTRPVCSAERSFVMTPMREGLRIGGAVELASLHAPPNYARAKALLALGREALPGLEGSSRREWMGCRPSMPDSLPVIGRSPRHPNVIVAFGHGHLGLTQGATTGRLVGDLALDRPGVIDLTPFRMDRF